MTQITRLTESEARAQLDQLIALLADAVNNGASVGFLRPLDANLARDYWHDVCASVGKGTKILLIARIDNHIVGSVQLDLCTRQNGLHRAEVQKLVVRSRYGAFLVGERDDHVRFPRRSARRVPAVSRVMSRKTRRDI